MRRESRKRKVSRLESNKKSRKFFYIEAAAAAEAGLVAAPGANEDDGMQFKGPHQQQQEPRLGKQYIFSSSIFYSIMRWQ